MSERLGFAGTVASAFIESKVTPLLVVASVALGAYAVVVTPKEDNPSIVVPVVEVLVPYPAAGSAEVDERAARPVAALMREIPRVEHVASAAGADGALITVQFREGVDAERGADVPGGLPSSYGQCKGVMNEGGRTILIFESLDDGAIYFVQVNVGKNSVSWKLVDRILRSAD